jgi:type II secretory pathway pseudopilin PulG
MANCVHRSTARGPRRRERGASLVEIAMVMAIVGVLVAVAVPNTIRWQRDQRLKGAAHDVADLLVLARSEALRTGNREVVFYGPSGTQDPSGTALTGPNGTVPFVVLNDGAAATSNCKIDAGEPKSVVEPVADVRWGVALATTRAPGDTGAANFSPPQNSGGTTASPAGVAVQWFLFRPDGVPVRFQGSLGACGTIGQTALGGAAFYLTNGSRDYAVVLSPMGGVRVHVWNQRTGAWSS